MPSMKAIALAALAVPALSSTPECAQQNMGYSDPSIANLNGAIVADAQTCQNSCAGLVTCSVWTYYENSGGCWLQGPGLTVQQVPGAISGPKTCANLGVDASTSLPAAGSPATDVSTEAPSTEAPSTEAPSTEAPSTEAPSAEVPSTEAPSTEAPSTEAPTTPEEPTTMEMTTMEMSTLPPVTMPEITTMALSTEAPTPSEVMNTTAENTTGMANETAAFPGFNMSGNTSRGYQSSSESGNETNASAATDVDAAEKASGGFPTYGYILIALGAAAIIALCSYFMCCAEDNKKAKKGKKTKRGIAGKVKPAADVEAAVPLTSAEQPAPMAPEPLPSVQAPMPMYQAAPSAPYQMPQYAPKARAVEMAAPQMMYSQPQQVTYAPQQSYSQVAYAAPQAYAAQPMQYAAYPQGQFVQQQAAPLAQNLFDAMDRNHDGVITRQEFQQVLGQR